MQNQHPESSVSAFEQGEVVDRAQSQMRRRWGKRGGRIGSEDFDALVQEVQAEGGLSDTDIVHAEKIERLHKLGLLPGASILSTRFFRPGRADLEQVLGRVLRAIGEDLPSGPLGRIGRQRSKKGRVGGQMGGESIDGIEEERGCSAKKKPIVEGGCVQHGGIGVNMLKEDCRSAQIVGAARSSGRC